MKKRIFSFIALAIVFGMTVVYANPVMAVSCTDENCAGGCTECTEEGCTAECCPVQMGDKCYPTLEAAVAADNDNETISLRGDVELSKNVGIKKEITIEGNGHVIKPTSDWKNNYNLTGDQSLITASGTGAKVTLQNVTLQDSKKYGAQAFDGGELILNKVTVNNCAYGGILANGGTVTVKDLTLGKNGTGKNNGIEISKGTSATTDPKLVMDGEIKSSETENVVYVAENDQKLEKFEVENTENSKEKIYVNGNSVVVTDEKGQVIYTSNENKKVTPSSQGNTAKTIYVVTIVYNGKKVSVVAESGKTLADVLDVNAIKNAVKGKKFVKFVKENGTDFNEAEKINSNLKLTAVYEDIAKEKDTTPKTGSVDFVMYAAIIVAASALVGTIVTKKSLNNK